MATVAGVKIKPKTKKITSVSIRENAKRDHSPKWDAVAELTAEQYADHFRTAMKYYRMESSAKDLKIKVIDWMGRNDYSKADIQAFKKTKDWRSHLTMGSIAASLIKGMPDVRQGFNQNKSSVEWLKNEIANVIDNGKYDVEDVVVNKTAKVAAPVVNIQDRIREQAGDMCEEIDYAIDSWIMDPEAFNPKDIKIVNLLKGKGAKAAQARYIKGFFASGLAELQELASGNADDQLKEGYKHVSRKNVKKLIDFYESIAQACEQIAAEAKVLKKPRAAKVKPAEEIVKKLKFMLTDTKLGVTSVPPATIVGAQGVVVLNVKTRKIGYYIAKSSEGIGVKNSSVTNFTEKSVQKTMRKPAEQVKEFKEQNTQRRFETWFTKGVKTTETVLNGRFSEDTIILKVYK
jgi:hypothetical protein